MGSPFDSAPPPGRVHPRTVFERLITGETREDARARAAIEAWLERFDDGEQAELSARLREDDRSFHSAFFELVLHELLVRLGYDVRRHPRVSVEHARSPDFIVWRESKPQFYLEATIVEAPESIRVRQRKLETVHLALREVSSRDFDLGLERAEFEEHDFPRALVIRSIEAWLQGLDPVAVDVRALSRREVGQPEIFRHEDLHLRVWAIPRPVEARGITAPAKVRLVGDGQVSVVVARQTVRRALRHKARHYGDLLLPYVIAVNALEPGCDAEDIQEAAFGTLSTHVFGPDAGEYRTIDVRESDGVLSDPGRSASMRVSAVLAEVGLTPWSIQDERITPVLFLNPEARMSLNVSAWPFHSHADGRGATFAERKGRVPLRKVLGLDRGLIL